MNSKGFNAVMLACLWTVLAFMYIPIIAIIGMSFNATPYGMFPYVFTTDWYVTLFTDSNLLPACWYSLKFAFAVTIAAVVIGTQTCGKGRYQQRFQMKDGSAVSLSTGQFFTPNGISLEGVGITPDVVVPVDETTAEAIYFDTLAPEEDPQLQAAVVALG